MRLSIALITGTIFSAAFALCVATAYLAVRVVEGWTTDTIQNAHEAAGLDWVAHTASGLTVTLRGTAPDEAARFQAMRLAATIISGDRIVDDMALAPAPAITPVAFSLLLLSNDSEISLVGLIPDPAERAFLIDALSKNLGSTPIVDLLDIANLPAPAGWQAAQEFAVAVVGILPQVLISLTPDTITISAITENETTKHQLETQLATLYRQRRDHAMELVLDLTMPRPIVSPYNLRLIQDAKGANLTVCSAETAQDAAMIRAAARSAGATATKACQIGLGSPSSVWPQAAAAAIEAVMQLKDTTLQVTDHTVSLTGTLRTNAERFNQIQAELAAELPKGFFVTAQRPDPRPIPSVRKPAQFIATRSPEGLVQLRGQVAADLAFRTITSYAQAQFGTDEVYMAARSAPDLGELWSIRVLTALDTLALVDKGIVRVTTNGFTLSGTTGDADREAQIERLLRRSLGPDAAFAIDITYIEPVAKRPVGPTAQACVATIATIIETQKIKFQPSSVKLEVDGRDVMDKIAKVLKKCGAIPLEIAGHTDSQGREEMNRKLSESRAQAVLTALMARRISVASFHARGYGETQPIADNKTADGREANRRIEFKLIDPKSLNLAPIADQTDPIDTRQDTPEND